MGFLNSSIILQSSGLYKCTIRYNYLYFFNSEEHESFPTLGEAKEWLLYQRCKKNLEIEEKKEEDVKEVRKEKVKNDLRKTLFNEIKTKNRKGSL